MKLLVFLLAFIVSCGALETDKEFDRVQEAKELQQKLINKAFTYQGRPASDKTYRGVPHSDDGDSELYAGQLCAVGMLQFCIKPRLAYLDSRDMLLGAAYYLLKTKDKEFNKELTEHLKAKDPRLCLLDACNYTPSLGDILARSGLKKFKKMPNEAIGAYLLTEARSAPTGYQMRLIADIYVFYKLAGLNLTNAIPRTLYDRQPCNSYFRYLAHGSYALKNLDVKPIKLYNYRWSQACDKMDVRTSNLWSEIYLLQISIKGIR